MCPTALPAPSNTVAREPAVSVTIAGGPPGGVTVIVMRLFAEVGPGSQTWTTLWVLSLGCTIQLNPTELLFAKLITA